MFPRDDIQPMITAVDPAVEYEFWGVRGHQTALTPEQRVQAAVLKDAFVTFTVTIHSRKPKRVQLFRETGAWVFDTRESDWPFTLENICEALGFCADRIRKRFRELEHGKNRSFTKAGRRAA